MQTIEELQKLTRQVKTEIAKHGISDKTKQWLDDVERRNNIYEDIKTAVKNHNHQFSNDSIDVPDGKDPLLKNKSVFSASN